MSKDLLLERENLHEIRSYNLGFSRARGHFGVMLQDDDLPPRGDGGAWARRAIELFELHPRLGAISCKDGHTTAALFGNHYGGGEPIPSRDPRVSAPFMFAVGINSAPVFYRMKAMSAVGLFNTSYSRQGEPGIGFETEHSYRMWRGGWQVGVMDCGDFDRGVGGHGTQSDPEKAALRKRIRRENWARMEAEYPLAEREGFAADVARLNAGLAPRPPEDICPEVERRASRGGLTRGDRREG
eukprot:CAMPEP_0182870646 /NCGR_PEP_ID=MMETSP0034_2-20130328/10656_1 /TAXON_ID=156128 /ORGANISM="Nephroselmis pyriformis, Strain CCMP717" /LENGTH=240 /DNA_ID=CAMNT_0025003157 /DNA_START=10 /DNA_END=728 /DNA_ORIENTATION=-